MTNHSAVLPQKHSSSSFNQPVRFFLLGLVLGAFAWRVQGLTIQSLWRDEVDAIYFALRNLMDTLTMFKAAGQNGPLYFLALRPWFYWVGASEFALRYPSAMAGAASVPLLWQVTRLLTGMPSRALPWRHNAQLIPLVAATLLAVNPYQLWYGQEGKMYAVITCLTLLATWSWLRGITSGGWRPWLAYLLTVSLAIYCHLLMILIFPLHFLWFLIAWPQSRRHWRGYGLALAGLTLPYLPMIWWQWDLLTTSERKSGFAFVPFGEMARVLFYSHSRGYLPTENLLPLAPLIFLAFAALFLGSSEFAVATPNEEHTDQVLWLAAWRRWLLVVSWLFVPILTIYLLSLQQPIFTDRYIIWIAPAAMILLALGSTAVRSNGSRLGLPLALLLVLYVAGFWLYAGWQQKNMTMKYDLRGAVQYLVKHRTANSLLILQIPYMEWSYRYYSGDFSPQLFQGSDARLAHWAGGLWTNGGLPDDQARAQVDQQMVAMTKDSHDIWVMRSEVEMWDARHLMDEWLDQHGQAVDQANFHGAQVKHYLLR